MTDRTGRRWPAIPWPAWRETAGALHMWCQVVGKYRLARAPWMIHSWHATLYPTPRGLTTGPVPDGALTLSLDFDLLDHRLVGLNDLGETASFDLGPMSVAAFLDRTQDLVRRLGGNPSIDGRPNEVPVAVPFAEDTAERPYDGDAVTRFHGALLSVDRVFRHYRTGFLGKQSPSHLFWGSFDLAVTRFSGRPAPRHPGGIPNLPDAVTHEAYSHEVASAGFWPGGGGIDEAMVYAYAYPTPDAYRTRTAEPAAARYDEALGEFLLPYEAVRTAADPDAALMAFLTSTYAAAADTAGWDRAALDCPLGAPGVPRPV